MARACLAALVITHPAFAQKVSEKEVQGIEAQEFGIESGKKQKVQQEQPPPEGQPEDYQPSTEPERVKTIEAEEFRVKMMKKSHTGRVLMFEDLTENRPRPGKILLLKKDNDDIAAVRVLKNYPGRFAAKVILPINDLAAETEYRAIKKLGDKIVALIREREKRGKDLDAAKTDEDLAKEVSPDDNELDRGIPQPKKGSKKVPKAQPDGAAAPTSSGGDRPAPLFTSDGQELGADSIEVKDEDEPYADLSIQEDLPLEPYRHAIALEYASMKSVDKDNNPASYAAFGLRYSYNFWRMPILKRRNLQDMFTVEAGLFYYTINGFVTADDSITVVPIVGTLRYSLLVGDNLTFFGYLGFVKNNVSQAQTTGTTTLTSNTAVLATTKAAMGIGASLRIGPAWAVRLDIGSDMFGIGAVLKF